MLFIWGTGKMAKRINNLLGSILDEMNVFGYIDNDETKWGKLFLGKTIYSPEVLCDTIKHQVYIANSFQKDIQKQIELNEKYNVEILENLVTRGQLLQRYKDIEDKEIQEIVERLKTKPLQVFNYGFVDKYDSIDEPIHFDDEKELFFVNYCGKKMYFSSIYKTQKAARQYYRSILLEQDEQSPHFYFPDDLEIPKDAVVIDAGVAEGNFSLSIIDKVKKIYLFEPDVEWCRALQYTFEPYKEKVVIINKFVSNYNNDLTVKIDDIVDEKVDLIKMDIEGEEIYALKGAAKTLEKSRDIKCIICAYHQEFAYEILDDFMKENGFNTNHSKGYMWFPDGGVHASVLRRGLIFAQK